MTHQKGAGPDRVGAGANKQMSETVDGAAASSLAPATDTTRLARRWREFRDLDRLVRERPYGRGWS